MITIAVIGGVALLAANLQAYRISRYILQHYEGGARGAVNRKLFREEWRKFTSGRLSDPRLRKMYLRLTLFVVLIAVALLSIVLTGILAPTKAA